MDFPYEWHTTASIAFRDAKCAFDRFKDKLRWREDGLDSAIDIGCATGYVAHNTILPALPKQFIKLKCVDISEEMLTFGRRTYNNPKVVFEHLDISKPIPTPIQEQFDHVLSFYCLHFVLAKDQQIAFKNLFNLMKPNSDCVLTIIGTNPSQTHYLEMMKSLKWAKYMVDAEQHITPYHFMDDPVKQIQEYLTEAGFIKWEIHYLNQTYDFNMSVYREFVRSINPFLRRIPIELHEEYLDEFMETILHFNPSKICDETGEVVLIFNYKNFHIYAEN